jgi:hypothetical protein
MRELNVFALAANGAIVWQKSFFDHIAKQFRIGAVSDARTPLVAYRTDWSLECA